MQIHEDKGCHCLALGYENYNLIGGFIAEVWISHSSKNWECVFVCIDKTTNPCLPWLWFEPGPIPSWSGNEQELSSWLFSQLTGYIQCANYCYNYLIYWPIKVSANQNAL